MRDRAKCANQQLCRSEESILLEGVVVGRHCRIRRAIIDKGVQIPAGTEIGYAPDEDKSRGWAITESGLVVIARGESVESIGRVG